MASKYDEYNERGIMFEQVRDTRFSLNETDSLYNHFKNHVDGPELLRNWSDIYILYQKDTKRILSFLWAKPGPKDKGDISKEQHPGFHLVEMIDVNLSERRKGYATDMIEMYWEREKILLIPRKIYDSGAAVHFWLKILKSLPHNRVDDKLAIGKCLTDLGYSPKDIQIWNNWHETLSEHLPDDLAVEINKSD